MKVPNTSHKFNEVVLNLTPIAWWKLDESSGTTAADSSGNGYDALYSGGASLTLGNAPLRAGGIACAQMTSISQWAAARASVASHPGLLIDTGVGSALTMACIVKVISGGATLAKVMGWGQIATGVNEGFADIQYRGSNNAKARDNTGNTITSGNSTLGTTIMLALTKAAGSTTNVWTLYENGTSVATVTSSWVAPSRANYWDIMGATSNAPPVGVDPGVTAYAMVGYGSDYMLFNYALTSAQLTLLAHSAGLI